MPFRRGAEAESSSVYKRTSTCRGATHMPKQVRIGVPEDSFEAQNYFVQVPKTQALYGCHLPVGQWRDELHGVGHPLRVGRSALLQYT